jgi:hypothetical protein
MRLQKGGKKLMHLGSKQSQMLDRAAALLPPSQQEAFFIAVHGVLDALLFHPPSDAALRDALRAVLATHGRSIGEILPQHQRNFVHDRTANNFRAWRQPHRQQETAR